MKEFQLKNILLIYFKISFLIFATIDRKGLKIMLLNEYVVVGVSSDPKCFGPNGEELDFWFIYRIGPSVENAHRDNYVYFNGSNFFTFLDIGDASSPLKRTLMQGSTNRFGSFVYNDQALLNRYGETKVSSQLSVGHSKGFAFYNQRNGYGIHVMHSFPFFPAMIPTGVQDQYTIDYTRPDWHASGMLQETQHYMCYTFKDPNIISTYMARVNAKVFVNQYDSSISMTINDLAPIPPDIKIPFDDFRRNIEAQSDLTRDQCRRNTSNQVVLSSGSINTRDGKYVTNDAKPFLKDTGIDIWYYIPKHFRDRAFFLSTKYTGGGQKFPNKNSKMIDVLNTNVADLLSRYNKVQGRFSPRSRYPTGLGKFDHDMCVTKMHVKMAFSLFPGDSNGIPLGGGGVLCFGSDELTTTFNRMIAHYHTGQGDTLSTRLMGLPYSVFTFNNATIVNSNGDPIADRYFEVVDRILKENPNVPETPQVVHRSPRQYILTNQYGSAQFYSNSIRSELPDNHAQVDRNFATQFIRSQSLYSLNYIVLDNLMRVCKDQLTCDNHISNIYGIPLALISTENHYPAPLPQTYTNLFGTGPRKFTISTPSDDHIYQLQKLVYKLVFAFQQSLGASDNFKPNQIRFTFTSNQAIFSKSYFEEPTPTRSYPLIYLYWPNPERKFDYETFAYLVTQNLLYQYNEDLNLSDKLWFNSLLLAVSKYLLFNELPTTKFSQDFINNRHNLDTLLRIPSNYDIEKTDRTIFNVENEYRYASTFWDLIDASNDKGFGRRGSEDKNTIKTVELNELLWGAYQMGYRSFNMYTFIKEMNIQNDKQKFKLAEQILKYNYMNNLNSLRLENIKIQNLEQPQQLNNLDNYQELRQILIENGNFGIDVVEALTNKELETIKLELDKWVFLEDRFTEAINVLLIDSTSPSQINEPIQLISYLESKSINNDLQQLDNQPQLCLEIDSTTQLEYYRICNPMSIWLLVDSLQDIIITSSSTAYRIGDLTLYFSESSELQPQYDGLVIATLNSKICDIKYSSKSQFQDKSIANEICKRSGPIIDRISESGGILSIHGTHFLQDDILQIANQNCTSTTVKSSSLIECTIPEFGIGFNQIISFSNRISYQQSKFVYNYKNGNYGVYSTLAKVNYNVPIFIGFSSPWYAISTMGSYILIKGRGLRFVDELEHVVIKSTYENIAQYCRVFNDYLQCKIPKGVGHDIPIEIQIAGTVLKDPSTDLVPTFSYQAPHINRVDINEEEDGLHSITIFGTNFLPRDTPCYQSCFIEFKLENNSFYKCPFDLTLYVDETSAICKNQHFQRVMEINGTHISIGAQFSNLYESREIKGTTFNDTDMDNQYKSSESVLSNVKVILKSPDGIILDSQLSSATGRFLFFDLPIYPYYILQVGNFTTDYNNSFVSENLIIVQSKSGPFTQIQNIGFQDKNIFGCNGYAKSLTTLEKRFYFQIGRYNSFNFGFGNCSNCQYNQFEFIFEDLNPQCQYIYNQATGELNIRYKDGIPTKVTLYMDDLINGFKPSSILVPPLNTIKFKLVSSYPNGTKTIKEYLHNNQNGEILVLIPYQIPYSYEIDSLDSIHYPILMKQEFPPTDSFPPSNSIGFFKKLENYPTVKFFDKTDQNGNCMVLPIGKFNSVLLNHLNWNNRIRSFNADPLVRVYISTTDPGDSVITTIPFYGIVNLATSTGQQIEISAPDYLPSQIPNTGSYVTLKKIYRGSQQPTILIDGKALGCKIETTGYKCFVRSNFGIVNSIQLIHNGLKLYHPYSIKFLSTYPTIGFPTDNGSSRATGTSLQKLYYPSTMPYTTEFLIDQYSGLITATSRGEEILRVERKDWSDPTATGLFTLKFNTNGNIFEYGIVLQRANGEVAWAKFRAPPPLYKTQSIHPLVYSLDKSYLDASNPNKNTLLPNEFITNGIHYLSIKADTGDLQLYTITPTGINVLWTSFYTKITSYSGPCLLKLEQNGDFCARKVTDQSSILWCAGTIGIGGRYLAVIPQKTSNLEWGISLLSSSGKMVYGRFPNQNHNLISKNQYNGEQFIEGNYMYASDINWGDPIPSPERYFTTRLDVGDFITNSQYYLWLENNGNLYLYDKMPTQNPTTRWSTQFNHPPNITKFYVEVNTFKGLVLYSVFNNDTIHTENIVIPTLSNSRYFNIPYPELRASPSKWSILLTNPTAITGGVHYMDTIIQGGSNSFIKSEIEWTRQIQNTYLTANFNKQTGSWTVVESGTNTITWAIHYLNNPAVVLTGFKASYQPSDQFCLQGIRNQPPTGSPPYNYYCVIKSPVNYTNMVLIPGIPDLVVSNSNGVIQYTMSNNLYPRIQNLNPDY
eukprot:gene8512-10465_t